MPRWTATIRDRFARLRDNLLRALLLLLALFLDTLSSLAPQKDRKYRWDNKQNQADQHKHGSETTTERSQRSDDAPQSAVSHNGGKQQRDRKNGEMPLWFLIVETFVGIALVIFGLGQVYVGHLQWDATDKQYTAMLAQNKLVDDQLKLTERTSKTELRANLLVSSVSLSKIAEEGPLRATVMAKNYGQTPASQVKVYVTAFAEELGYTGPFARGPEQDTKSSGIIAPGDAFIIPLTMGDISDDDRVLIAHGQRLIWVFGTLEYVDVFGDSHCTEFRFVNGGPAGFLGGEMAVADGGNASHSGKCDQSKD